MLIHIFLVLLQLFAILQLSTVSGCTQTRGSAATIYQLGDDHFNHTYPGIPPGVDILKEQVSFMKGSQQFIKTVMLSFTVVPDPNVKLFGTLISFMINSAFDKNTLSSQLVDLKIDSAVFLAGAQSIKSKLIAIQSRIEHMSDPTLNMTLRNSEAITAIHSSQEIYNLLSASDGIFWRNKVVTMPILYSFSAITSSVGHIAKLLLTQPTYQRTINTLLTQLRDLLNEYYADAVKERLTLITRKKDMDKGMDLSPMKCLHIYHKTCVGRKSEWLLRPNGDTGLIDCYPSVDVPWSRKAEYIKTENSKSMFRASNSKHGTPPNMKPPKCWGCKSFPEFEYQLYIDRGSGLEFCADKQNECLSGYKWDFQEWAEKLHKNILNSLGMAIQFKPAATWRFRRAE